MFILPGRPKAEAYFAQRTWPLGARQEVFGLSSSELKLKREIDAILFKHYPGYPWGVSVSDDQGVALIRNPALKTPRNQPLCMVVRLAELAGDPGLRVVVSRAGEMLERWGLRRGGLVIADYKEQAPAAVDITPPKPRSLVV